MASCLRCLTGCVAPFFAVYTILVTYFLAQSAWDDVSSRLRRRNDARFLDVLVQEERRHFRSFQDVVKTYRGDVHMGDKFVEYKRDQFSMDKNYLNKSIRLSLDTNNTYSEPTWKVHHPDTYKDDDNGDSYNETYLPKDLRLQLEQQEREITAPRPRFQVEVEDWGEQNGNAKSSPEASNYSSQTSSLNKVDAKYIQRNVENNHVFPVHLKISTSRNQNPTLLKRTENVSKDTDYTAVFCDNVFDVFNTKPTICRRELAELYTANHVTISTYSALFMGVGDIFIFSAFLDTRQSPYVVRLLALGPRGFDNGRSVYWCVFYVRSLISDGHNVTVGGKQISYRQPAQLVYYVASDGHNRSNQFYIMSCPVPDTAKSSVLPPHRGLFQVVTGTQHRPYLGKGQDSLTLKLIRNSDAITLTNLPAAPKDSSYFDKMKDDLSTLSIKGIESDSNHRHIPNNSSSLTNNGNNKVISLTDSDVDKNGIYKTNSSDDKIVSCVAPLQGKIGVIQLVEYIEFTLLLGSQHIVFYTFQITEDIKQVLSMYEARGLITVLPWNLPSPDSVWANGRDMALNDCLYRTMHVYDYALFLDLDEFLVPRVTSDIPSFLKYLKVVHRFNSTKFSDLVFSSTYFPPPSKAQYHNLTTADEFTKDMNKFISLKSVHRTYFNPKHPIRMIKQSKAMRVGAGERKRTSFTISPRFAVVHHYSYCPRDASTASKNTKNGNNEKDSKDICSHTKQDFITWRYKHVLIQRVKDSVRRLNRG